MYTAFIELVRIKEWLKNLILFLPLIFSNNILNFDKYNNVIIAILIFCLASSFIYIINDIKDLEHDKLHPIKKKKKPLANKKLGVYFAKLFSIFLLLIISVILFINIKYFYHISLYIMINIFYTFFAKKILFIDLLILSFGYIIRVDLGSVAIGVQTSILMFLTIFSLSFFVISLKRIGDLNINIHSKKNIYKHKSNFLKLIILTSAYLTIFFYTLYVILINIKFSITIPIIILFLHKYYKKSINTNEGGYPIDLLFKDKFLLILSIIYFICVIIIYL